MYYITRTMYGQGIAGLPEGAGASDPPFSFGRTAMRRWDRLVDANMEEYRARGIGEEDDEPTALDEVPEADAVQPLTQAYRSRPHGSAVAGCGEPTRGAQRAPVGHGARDVDSMTRSAVPAGVEEVSSCWASVSQVIGRATRAGAAE